MAFDDIDCSKVGGSPTKVLSFEFVVLLKAEKHLQKKGSATTGTTTLRWK